MEKPSKTLLLHNRSIGFQSKTNDKISQHVFVAKDEDGFPLYASGDEIMEWLLANGFEVYPIGTLDSLKLELSIAESKNKLYTPYVQRYMDMDDQSSQDV